MPELGPAQKTGIWSLMSTGAQWMAGYCGMGPVRWRRPQKSDSVCVFVVVVVCVFGLWWWWWCVCGVRLWRGAQGRLPCFWSSEGRWFVCVSTYVCEGGIVECVCVLGGYSGVCVCVCVCQGGIVECLGLPLIKTGTSLGRERAKHPEHCSP